MASARPSLKAHMISEGSVESSYQGSVLRILADGLIVEPRTRARRMRANTWSLRCRGTAVVQGPSAVGRHGQRAAHEPHVW